MSAEPRQVTKAEVWATWESHVVNGTFPLRRFLGCSAHSAVFLTEHKALNLTDVVIKFVPDDAPGAGLQLEQWQAAATVSHPHLIRLFDAGRCELDGRGFLFVVMELAEQNLAQILPHRALSSDEVREMLLPTLDALAFLHRRQWVHGQLRPSKVLVVNDQLKLASDAMRPMGAAPGAVVRTGLYNAPELRDGGASIAGDIWALGVTLVESLTQHPPVWSGEQSETVSLPTSVPAPLASTVRRCLSHAPGNRPSAVELEAQYKPAPQAREVLTPPAQLTSVPPARVPSAAPARVTSVPPARMRDVPRVAHAPRNFTRAHLLLSAIAAALVVFLIAWVVLGSSHRHPDTSKSASDTSQPAGQPPAVAARPTAPATASPAAAAPAAPSAVTKPAGVTAAAPNLSPQEVIPDVPRNIRNGIRGHIKVTVRVLVDPSGKVVGDLLEKAGPSRYFAHLARDAATEWKFAPTDNPSPRVWLLRFEFTRSGATVHATAAH